MIALIGVLAWTALRGGGASIDAQTVQEIVQDDVLAELSESLDVNEDEARRLYEQGELLEAAEDNGLTREELISETREVTVTSLQEAVRQDRISAEQAERALRMTMRAITNHL